MDHKDFLQALPDQTRAALTARDDRPTIIRLATHGGAIMLLAAYILLGLPGWFIAIPVLGALLAFLFTIEHEATHQNLLGNGEINDWIGRICGFVIVLPFQWFRYFHMAHHRYTNIAGKDPEIAGGPRPNTRRAFFWHVSGIPYWLAEGRVLMRLASRHGQMDDFIPAKGQSRTRTEARVMLAGYALAVISLLFSPALLWIWIVPVVIGQMLLRVFLLAEHADCPMVANMLENTRTTFTTRLMRWISWNASYHVEHHVYPTAPFHKLPELHRIIRQELRVTDDGYTAFTRNFLARLGNAPPPGSV